MNPTSPDKPDSAQTDRRRLRLAVLAALVVVAGLAYGAYWFLHARFFVSTDDAYVAADLVQISSEVAGTVTAVDVDDTQPVQRGQLLLQLDPADAEVAMASAEAELARAVRQVRGLYSQTDGLRAQIGEREIALRAARADLARREQVAAEGGVSAEEMQHARDQVAQYKAALGVSQENLTTTQSQVVDTTPDTHPQVLVAAARLREAALALRRTRIVAPVAGVVARRSVQVGARIAPGAPLMAVVPLDRAWVDANFKEVQIAGMHIGQPVALRADVYGGDVDYDGRIAGLGAGSGSAFALLPAQNASGNWIKVVQRVPVRIALDPRQLAAHPLRVGLSMAVTVDLRQSSAGQTPPLRAAAQRTPVEEGDDAVDQKIAAIIAANAGSASAPGRASP